MYTGTKIKTVGPSIEPVQEDISTHLKYMGAGKGSYQPRILDLANISFK